MGCDQCQAEGKTSRCAQLKQIVDRTPCIQFYDEEGRAHVHDGTVVVTPFRCTNGHTWEHRGITKCPTCREQVDPRGSDEFGRPLGENASAREPEERRKKL